MPRGLCQGLGGIYVDSVDFVRGMWGFCDPGVDKSAVLMLCSLRSQDLERFIRYQHTYLSTFITYQKDYKHINDTNPYHYHLLITIIIIRLKQLIYIF